MALCNHEMEQLKAAFTLSKKAVMKVDDLIKFLEHWHVPMSCAHENWETNAPEGADIDEDGPDV